MRADPAARREPRARAHRVRRRRRSSSARIQHNLKINRIGLHVARSNLVSRAEALEAAARRRSTPDATTSRRLQCSSARRASTTSSTASRRCSRSRRRTSRSMNQVVGVQARGHRARACARPRAQGADRARARARATAKARIAAARPAAAAVLLDQGRDRPPRRRSSARASSRSSGRRRRVSPTYQSQQAGNLGRRRPRRPTPDGVTSRLRRSTRGVVAIAMQYLGVPYVWGGESPSGFDCSGLVMYVYAQVGVSLPHYTGAQWNAGVPVSRERSRARRPRLLRRARPRRHLHRRRRVHPRAAHGRRRQDRQPLRSLVRGDVRRRPPHRQRRLSVRRTSARGWRSHHRARRTTLRRDS